MAPDEKITEFLGSKHPSQLPEEVDNLLEKRVKHRHWPLRKCYDVEPEHELRQHATHSSHQRGGCCGKLVRYEERLGKTFSSTQYPPSGLTKVKNTWILNSFHHPSELRNRFIARGRERSIVMLRHSWGAVKRPSGSS